MIYHKSSNNLTPEYAECQQYEEFRSVIMQFIDGSNVFCWPSAADGQRHIFQLQIRNLVLAVVRSIPDAMSSLILYCATLPGSYDSELSLCTVQDQVGFSVDVACDYNTSKPQRY